MKKPKLLKLGVLPKITLQAMRRGIYSFLQQILLNNLSYVEYGGRLKEKKIRTIFDTHKNYLVSEQKDIQK